MSKFTNHRYVYAYEVLVIEITSREETRFLQEVILHLKKRVE